MLILQYSMKKFLIGFFFILVFSNNSSFSENYFYGGAKLFNYGVETSDLQEINTSLVSLGFSSSTSETDNTGLGFDIGIGVGLVDNFAVEAGYVNYGTLEITTKTTGPVENIKTEITGDGVTIAGVLNAEGLYLKGGMHSWDFTGKVTASLGTSSEPLGTGTDPFFGIGYNSNNFISSVEYYKIEDGDITSVNIAYRMPF